MNCDHSKASRSLRLSRFIAFTLPIALLAYYALRGGSYDSVVWQAEAVAVWVLLGVGFAFGILPRRRLYRGLAVPLAAAGLLAAWAALGLIWTESAERTVLELGRIVHYAGVLLLAWSLLDRRTRAPAAYGIAVAAIGIAAAAVASRMVPEPFPPDAVREEIGVYRLNYPFDYWNALAAWGAMAIAFALTMSIHAHRLWVRAAFLAAVPVCGLAVYLTYSRGGLLSVAVALVAVLVLSTHRRLVVAHAVAGIAGAALAVAGARANPAIARGPVGPLGPGEGAAEAALALLLGTLLCIATAMMLARARERGAIVPRLAGSPLFARVRAAVAGRRTAVTIAVALAALVLVVGGAILAGLPGRLSEVPGIATGGSGEDPSERLIEAESSRPSHWAAALEAFWSNPATGTGAGTYEFWWNRGGAETFARDAHSLYLEHLAEGGLPAFVLIVGLIGSLVVLAWRGRAKWDDEGSLGAPVAGTAALVVFVVHAALDWLWEVPAVTLLALLGAAVASAPTERVARWPAALRAAGVAAAVLACALQVPTLAGVTRVEDSEAAFRAGDVEGAEEAAADAADLEPWAAAPYVQLALIDEADGRLTQAERHVRDAIEREPTNWVHWELLARIEEARGDSGAAEAAYEEARRLRPVVPPPTGPDESADEGAAAVE